MADLRPVPLQHRLQRLLVAASLHPPPPHSSLATTPPLTSAATTSSPPSPAPTANRTPATSTPTTPPAASPTAASSVDYLADRLGLPLGPSYLALCGRTKDMIRGVNYAFGTTGFIHTSGLDMGMDISLSQQVQQAIETIRQLESILGEEKAMEHVSRSVFYMSIRSNVFIDCYFSYQDQVQKYDLPWKFEQIAKFMEQLKVT